MVEHRFCNPRMAVRFCHGAPDMGAVVGYGLPLQGRCLEGFDFLGLHQFYLSKALSGCVHGLGPCGPGSNPGRETKLCSNSTKASTPVL